MTLMSSYDVVAKRAEYAKTKSGWQAEFRGPIVVRVEAVDLESCRRAIFNAVDAKVVEWLLTEGPTPASQPPAGNRRASRKK